MIENEKQLKQVLLVLNKEGMLPNLILIGSWCLLFYQRIFDNFDPLLRTTDIDFCVPNPKKIKEKTNVIDTFKTINYDLIQDTLTNKSTFVSPDGFELEFLTNLNRKQLACVKLGNTDIYAESLSYVDIFFGNYISVKYDGILVNVASPSSYIFQKLLINSKRKDKQEKDIESIKHVLNYVKASKKYAAEFLNLYNSLPPKWKKIINQSALDNDICLFDD